MLSSVNLNVPRATSPHTILTQFTVSTMSDIDGSATLSMSLAAMNLDSKLPQPSDECSKFLQLPREVRNRIFELALIIPNGIRIDNIHRNKRSGAIFRASRQLYNEASQIYFHENVFHCPDRLLYEWLGNLRPENRKALREVHLNLRDPSFHISLAAIRNMMEFLILRRDIMEIRGIALDKNVLRVPLYWNRVKYYSLDELYVLWDDFENETGLDKRT